MGWGETWGQGEARRETRRGLGKGVKKGFLGKGGKKGGRKTSLLGACMVGLVKGACPHGDVGMFHLYVWFYYVL